MTVKIDKHFYKTLFFVALPITLQNLTQSFVNMLDTIMVGQLGSIEIAAVGLGNQIFFILNMILFGIASGGSIFISQYWGKKDLPNIHKILGLLLFLASIVSLLVTLFACIIPETLISLYSNDKQVISVGGHYLRIVAISYPITAISFILGQSFRSTEHVTLPMISTAISLVINGILNFLLIFGIGIFPKLGVLGAAIATIVSRCLEFFILFFVAQKRKYEVLSNLKELYRFTMYSVQRYIKIALPVILNETFWSLGISMQNSIFAKLNTDAITAFNITGTISQLTWVFFIGVGNAAAIIIGKQIGAGNNDTAYTYANRFSILMPIMSVFIGILLIPLSSILPFLFKVSPSILNQASAMLLVMLAIYPLKSFNLCFVVGICRAGGDTVFAAICDVAFMWCIALPLAAIAGLHFHLAPWIVYLCIVSEDFFKTIMGIWRIKSKKWLHNVT